MSIALGYIDEPSLTFGYGQKMTDPRDGLTLFGPYTRSKVVGPVNVGIIGSPDCRSDMMKFMEDVHHPIYGPENDPARPYFAGLEAAFNVYFNMSNVREIDVPTQSIEECMRYTDGHIRIHKLSELFVNGITKYANEKEMPIDLWFVVIPDSIYKYGRPKSVLPKAGNLIRTSIRHDKRGKKQPFLFDDLNKLNVAYQWEKNFHNQIKGKLLSSRIVTQIIRQSTIAYGRLWTDQKIVEREKRYDSAKAWNIMTTMYYKIGGIPWKLNDVRDGVCYIGLVYKELEDSQGANNACCAAQMFLDSGDGMVFRGNIGPWYNSDTKEYHLRKSDAKDLIAKALESYSMKNNVYPREIFIHAKTYFNDEEWVGFESAADGKSKVYGVRIRNDAAFKIYREYRYPAPRGIILVVDKKSAYLWTKGFIPRIQTVMGLETPNPLSIELTRGTAEIETVCKDVLALTKLNYNSCIYGDGMPVTLRFADAIGEILTAGPEDEAEVLPFKHYV